MLNPVICSEFNNRIKEGNIYLDKHPILAQSKNVLERSDSQELVRRTGARVSRITRAEIN